MTNDQYNAVGGRVVKWKGRVVSIAPALASVSVVALMTTGAIGQTVIDTRVIGEQYIAVDENVTVTADGRVLVFGGTESASLYVEVADYDAVIANNGSIDFFQVDGTNASAIWLEGNLGGSVVNNGDIDLDLMNSNSDASASGIYVSGDLDGKITNASSGLIDVLVGSDNHDVDAYGIVVGGNVGEGAAITNAGTINSEANSEDNDALAYGITAGGLDGLIDNSGTIDVRAASGTDEATAYGVYVAGDVGSTGTIKNSGDLLVEARAGTSESAYGYGIFVDGDLYGSITNTVTGLIDVDAQGGSSSASAYGVYVSNSVAEGASIVNQGVLTVDAYNPQDSTAVAYGIYVDSDMDGTIENAGTIDVYAASGTSSATAYGIYIGNDVGSTGSIRNSGELLVEARAGTESSVSAYGIYVGGDLYGSISNADTGLIEVVAEGGTSYASAYGVYISGSVEEGASIVNQGVLTVDAYNPDSSTAVAYGIYVGSYMDGTIENAGTIDVYAASGTSSATAYGIYIGNDVGSTGSIRNSGDLLVEARAGTESSVNAYGIYVGGDLYGSISNADTGLIEVVAEGGTSYASGYGIYVSGSVEEGASIVNKGMLTVDVYNPVDSTASAYGIYVGSYMDGTIENTGTIDIYAESGTSYAYAYGVYVSGTVGGDISNAGDIFVEAFNGTSSTAYAYGIYTGTLDGTITNSGSIDAYAHSATYDGDAYGIYVDGDVNGSITNTESGVITAKASAPLSNAEAYGVYVDDDVKVAGTIVNAGRIEAFAETLDSSSASAWGIYISDDMDGTLENSGDVLASAMATAYSAYAYGVEFDDDMDGTMTNTGTITALAHSTGSQAYAHGIKVDESVDGSVENRGRITVGASSTSDYVYAAGISVDGTLDDALYGSIINSGTVEVNVNAPTGEGYGIYAAQVEAGGLVSNSGYIDVMSQDSGTSYESAGVYLDSMLGHFINTGSIVANEDGSVGRAIYIDGAGGLVTLSTKGFIEGNIELAGDIDLNVQGDVGRSVRWTVDTSNTTVGAIFTDSEGYLGSTVFERGGDSEVEFATLDSSGLAAVRQAGADAGFIGLGALVAKTSSAVAFPVQVTNGNEDDSSFMPFAAASSRTITYGGSETMLDQDIATRSLTFGGTLAMDGGLSLGLAAGTMVGTAKVGYIDGPSSETDQKGSFIGFALGGSSGNLNFAGGITGGRLQFDNTRYVNDNLVLGGIVTEEASFDSTFLAAEFAVSGRFDMGSGMALVPNMKMRFARHNVDGYLESGSDAAAEVGAQNVDAFEGEIGVALEKAAGSGFVTGGISVLSRSITGDEDVLVTMIGDTEVVDTTIGSSNAAKLSLGYSSSFSASGEFNVGVETLVGSSGMSGGTISGEIRFSF